MPRAPNIASDQVGVELEHYRCGVVPLATGLFNFCPLHALLGIDTCKSRV